MNWLLVAAVMAVLYLGPFLVCLGRKRWTVPALFVGLVNLFLAFLNSVAPVRGWADPGYFGYSFGLLRVEPGPGVTLVAGSIVALAAYSACVAVLDRTGLPMRVAAIFDGLVAANVGGAIVRSVLRDPTSMKIQLGEYLTIGPLGAAFVEVGLLVVPLALASAWAWKRSFPSANGPSADEALQGAAQAS